MDAARAAVWAAERTGGLLDPTLVDELELAGYGHSLDGATPASLAEAIAAAPRPRPASPNPAQRVAQDPRRRTGRDDRAPGGPAAR